MTDVFPLGGHCSSVRVFTLFDDSRLSLQKNAPIVLHHDITDEYIRTLNPSLSVSILYPARLRNRTIAFQKAFTGHVLYAVKCNSDPILLHAIYEGGVRRFDVASIGEVRLIKRLFPEAKLYFMHPIKAHEAIREAYSTQDVRAFVFDCADEMDKILYETNTASDLELFVRLRIPKDAANDHVATDFAAKFGANLEEAVDLLRRARPYCVKLGLSFHVGTQCHDPVMYTKAISHAAKVIAASGVLVDVLDVGGGFPAELTANVPPITAFTEAIARAIDTQDLGQMELLCEVGRGLVACAGSLIVRVEGRKGDLLYVNDGTYGGMFEAGGSVGLSYPVHAIRRKEGAANPTVPMMPFRFAGPTCDSVDMMRGPFILPADVCVNDWIRVDELGAYGEVSRTNFNGFGCAQVITVAAEEARAYTAMFVEEQRGKAF